MGLPVFARVWFDSHKKRGHVHCGDVDIDLEEPPDVLGQPAEIDYSEIHPDMLGWAQIRRSVFERMREMEPDEIQAVHDWLREVNAKSGPGSP